MAGLPSSLLVAAAAAAFFAAGGHRYLSFEQPEGAAGARCRTGARRTRQAAAVAFFAAYVAVTGLSLPGAALLTLAGGALFGLLWGTMLVSFASSIGATLAFLASRFVLRDWVQRALRRAAAARSTAAWRRKARSTSSRCASSRRCRSSSSTWRWASRAMRVRTFYWVSQLGMLAGTIVYVNAGTQLGRDRVAARHRSRRA